MPATATTLKDLNEKRGKAWHDATALNDKVLVEKRKFTAEEQAAWDKLNGEIDAVGTEIDRVLRLKAIEDQMRSSRGGDPGLEDTDADDGEDADAKPNAIADQAMGIRAWLKATSRAHLEVSDVERAAAKRAKIPLDRAEVEIRLLSSADLDRLPRDRFGRRMVESRDQSNETPTLGGYLRPEGFVPRIERALLQFGPMRQVAELIRTNTGNPLPWPTSDDTSNEGAQIGESTAPGTVDVAIGSFVMGAYKYSSKFIKVPRELLEDAGVDIAGYIADRLGERLARIQNRHATTGDGAGKPRGVVNSSFLGVTAAGAAAITPDEVIDLAHSVDPAYREQPGCGYMMNDGVLKAIRKLKDSQNHYLWTPSGQGGLVQGAGGILYDKPVYVNQHMQATLATGTKTMLFGLFSAYKMREVGSVVLKRLVERFADADQEGFIAFLRFDSGLLDAGTHPVKHLIQA